MGISRRQVSYRLEGFPACLLEPVLLELPHAAEELVIRFAVFLGGVFQCSELNRAQVVGGLLQPVFGHGCLGASYGVLEELVADGAVEGMAHDWLTVVAIDFHAVKPLESGSEWNGIFGRSARESDSS